jgi:hypothetical protein
MIRNAFAAALLMLCSTAALAGSCPLHMAAIDEALADPQVQERLTEEQLAQIRELREQGEAYHQSGEHDKSVETLTEAREILGIS